MKIDDVIAPGFAVRGSAVAIRVKTRGFGVLRVAHAQRLVFGARETTLVVSAAPTIRVGDRIIRMTIVEEPARETAPRVNVRAPPPLKLALVVTIGDIP